MYFVKDEEAVAVAVPLLVKLISLLLDTRLLIRPFVKGQSTEISN